MPQTRPRPILFTFFPTDYSLTTIPFDTVQCELLTPSHIALKAKQYKTNVVAFSPQGNYTTEYVGDDNANFCG
jgi:hypothetical protein